MVRLKHRYLLVNILYPPTDSKPLATDRDGEQLPWVIQFRQPSSDRLDGKVLMQLIRKGVSELFGDYGSGMIAGSLQVKYFSPATSTAIIRVSRAHYRLVWAALTLTTHLPKPIDQPCVFQVVRVSGTIKKSEEEAIRRARMSIRRVQKAPGRSYGDGSGVLSTGALTDAAELDDGSGLDLFNGIEDDDLNDEDEDGG